MGICGRTGSGKSSILLALLRLNLIIEGDIVLDGTSILSYDLETSRRLISIIPQDPHLFSGFLSSLAVILYIICYLGTIRFNLDPFNSYSDVEIWSALKDAHIYDYIQSDSDGLLSHVEEGGKNFSVGQRQLLSLARAILRGCKVVLMDEVTASIDFETDKLIQETIRVSPALSKATIITVAHRLRTIADSDKIVVFQSGELVEIGEPMELLNNKSSHFYNFAEKSNELDEIFAIASKKQQSQIVIH